MDSIPVRPFLEWRASDRGVSTSGNQNLWWEKQIIAIVELGGAINAYLVSITIKP
jgi:hypothetical protein